MNKFTRRVFGKHLLAASALPLLKLPEFPPQTPEPVINIPDIIAGYKLSPEDKQLAAKFLTTHEKNLAVLREKDLPNNLPPVFSFSSPRPKSDSSPR